MYPVGVGGVEEEASTPGAREAERIVGCRCAGVGQPGGARAAAAAKAYGLTARLAPAAEVPRPKGAAGGAGTFTATITITGTHGSPAWKLTFDHLTGPAVAAHVHLAAPGKAGPV